MRTDVKAARPAGEKLTLATLLAVALVGVAVVAGWHLHVRALVQVIPGAIPMQYNTALCFVAVGASGWALVAGRGGRWLPALGGAFAGLMGALVVFQYATGTSLGVDTFFFYPWERTLSADPGRMALTSAISFTCAGLALAALALTRRAFAPSAVLHTLPLSFGLTSALGYAVGITFVLPFRLGSQMAIHTALTFTAYSLAMLAHAWTHSPRGEEGLPRWYPATAVLVVPFLFVGLSLMGGDGSEGALVAHLGVSAACALALGIAIHRVTKWRVARKGLVLISVPLAFVLAFVVLVTRVRHAQEEAQSLNLRSKEVIAQAETVLKSLIDAQSSVRGYVITGDPEFAEPYRHAMTEVPEGIRRLKELAPDDPAQQARVSRLEAKAAERMGLLAEIERLVSAGGRDEAAGRVKTGAGKRVMDEIRHEMSAFLREEERLDAEQHRAVESLWQRFDWLLVSGTSVDVLLTLMLAFLFTRSIGGRLRTLNENTARLAEGRELAEPLGGRDEIAHLDRVFHEMAEALDEAARKERAVVENSLDVICTVDEEGKFVKVSPASYKVWGYHPEELMGRRYIEMVAPEDVERTNRAALDIMAGSAETDFENCYRRKDGSLVHIMWSASWSENERLMYCVAHDITERKQAEEALRESQERYRLLFDSNPHPIWVYDMETLAFLTVNEAAIRRYGYSREEFLSRTIKDIRPPEDVSALLENVSKVTSGIDEAGAWKHQKKGGEIIDVEIISHQLIYAGRNAELVLANDVTERKRAERLAEERKLELEKMAASLTTSNKELEAFSYSVSHDLRAPLRAVDGFSRILLEDYEEKLDDEGRRLLAVIRANTQKMGQLIDDLLAFSRLGRKQIEKTEIDMGLLARDVSAQVDAARDDGRAARWKIAPLPAAHGDRAMIAQVFVNLLANAVKYSGAKDAAVVEVGGCVENGENIYHVKDNGVGFDMRYAHKLFGVFQRLHGPEEFEGTGVGLAIVKRVVERHGGRVWAEGAVDEGATFYFTLPRGGGDGDGRNGEH